MIQINNMIRKQVLANLKGQVKTGQGQARCAPPKSQKLTGIELQNFANNSMASRSEDRLGWYAQRIKTQQAEITHYQRVIKEKNLKLETYKALCFALCILSFGLGIWAYSANTDATFDSYNENIGSVVNYEENIGGDK